MRLRQSIGCQLVPSRDLVFFQKVGRREEFPFCLHISFIPKSLIEQNTRIKIVTDYLFRSSGFSGYTRMGS